MNVWQFIVTTSKNLPQKYTNNAVYHSRLHKAGLMFDVIDFDVGFFSFDSCWSISYKHFEWIFDVPNLACLVVSAAVL